MKKIFIYLISFIFICFIVPAILTNKKIEETSSNDVEEIQNKKKEEISEYQYQKYATIKLLHKETSQVEEINIDEYLYSVVSAEMPASFNKEALKVQAIVARTYTIYKIQNRKHENADICDDSTCCQAWITKEDRLSKWNETERNDNWEKICEAVDSTKGKIITYDNKIINALFHSNSGGTTEEPINVWGGSDYPYLQSVSTAGEERIYTIYI